ncbi:MarR family winged helix-turn-helix transcriptional regulator [Microbacterium sp. RD1]|uniref:MarR family winged helix-turn-helix transcriptional regulator n=1 Tax=Microbacterium sp. RD1 TaxID=3457313 RepID=UPI003FA5A4DE
MTVIAKGSGAGASSFLRLETACGYLIRRTQQVHNVLWAEEFDGRLTSPQYAVLAALAAEPGIDQRRLGELASLDKSSIADVVSRLASRLWIVRERDSHDGRRNVLQLTSAAELAFHQLTPPAQRVQDRLLAPLDEQEAVAFTAGLATIARAHPAPTLPPGRTSPVLELSAPGHLIRRAQQQHTAIWADLLDRELTGPQCAVLYVVAEEPGVSQKRLGERAALDKSTAADLVQRLVRRGWLTRERMPEDARGRMLTLTPEGLSVVERTATAVRDVQAQLLSPLDEPARAAFVEMLSRVAFASTATSD